MFSNTGNKKIWKTAILPLVDFISVFLGTWVVYLIRYSWFQDNFAIFNSSSSRLALGQYLSVSLGISVLVVLIYSFFGIYQIQVKKQTWNLFFSLMAGIFLVLLSLITFLFFNEYNRNTLPAGVPISRFVLGAGGFFALYFVLLGRGLLWSLEQILYHFDLNKINIAIIGDQEGFLNRKFENYNNINKIFNYAKLNSENLSYLKKKISRNQLAEVYLVNSKGEATRELAMFCERYNVSFIFSPEGFAKFQAFGLKPFIIDKKVFLELKHSNLDGWQIVLKRLFDISFALAFLICFSWLYILIAVLIKLDSRGGIFYLSERVAPDGKVFRVWKFRRLKQEFCTSEKDSKSLALEKELIAKQDFRKDGVLYKIKNDPRSTRVGAFLEKASLDELPQFFNVLKGDLSLVGPRPHQPREVAKYKNHHYKVLNIQPGLTGFAQINGRSDLSFEEEVYYDTYYIEHWSFWLDLWIIIKTPFIILFNKHTS